MNSIDDSVPEAKILSINEVQARRWRTRLWWLTALCVLIAIGLTANSLRAPGEKIRVHFRDGFGIKTGDTLRYRGIDLGSVTEVHLDDQMQGVVVHIQLAPEHAGVANEGSRFWIERPRLRIGQVSGLETVLGAKFIGMIPGPREAVRKTEFTGMENPLGNAEQDSIDIRVRFPKGEGLSTGDTVRHLGIAVGEVTYVEMDDALDAVWVGARLVGSAQKLARSGTQFWIERPRLAISEIRGLETLVGGRYLAMEPGLKDSEIALEFNGLSEAPPLARRQGSLEIELEAHSRLGLLRGAPISFRGVEVGVVADVALATDGASVIVRAFIEPEYVDLVRKNSVWWSTGGVQLDAGLAGISLSVESFTSWLRGGISFATPDSPGEKVFTGYRFGLADKPEPEWLKWQPRLAAGPWSMRSENATVPPRVLRAAATWQTRFLGIARRNSAESWCLPLSSGQMCVPHSLIKASLAAKTRVSLELAGISIEIDPSKITERNGLSIVALPREIQVPRWPINEQLHSWNGKTTLLVFNPELGEPMPLDSARAAGTSAGLIEVNQSVPIHKSMEGSAVIDTATGELLGLLVRLDKGWFVAPIPR